MTVYNMLDITQTLKHKEGIDVILNILGYPDEEVSDLTEFGDFLDDKEDMASLLALSDIFGVQVGIKSKLWEVSRDMENNDNG